MRRAIAQNRVTPLGEIVAAPLRCEWMGNRGVLHTGGGERRVVRGWSTRAWIICAPEFRGRRVPQWAPGRYTPLFLYDEAVALAAGHRPCGECRRSSYVFFRDVVDPGVRAPELDARLHAERTRGPHPMPWGELPAGTFVALDDGPALVLEDAVVPWTTAGYGAQVRRPRHGNARVITPATSVGVLAAGYPVSSSASRPT